MSILTKINAMDAKQRDWLKLHGAIIKLNALKIQLGHHPLAMPPAERLIVKCKNKRRFNPAEHPGLYINGPRLARVNLPINRVKFMDAK